MDSGKGKRGIHVKAFGEQFLCHTGSNIIRDDFDITSRGMSGIFQMLAIGLVIL